MEIPKKRKKSHPKESKDTKKPKNQSVFSQYKEAVQKRIANTIASPSTSNPDSNINAKQAAKYKIIFLIFRNSTDDLQLQTPIINNLKSHLDTGADVNVASDTGQTALHLAVKNRMTQVIDFLISRGANMDVLDKQGNSLLHFLIHYEAQKFQNYSTIVDPVERRAFEKNSIDFIEWMVSKKSRDVDDRNKKEETALHLAAKYNLLHAIMILLKYTRYMTIYDYLGMTAFQIFVESAICRMRQNNPEGLAAIPMSNYEPMYVEQVCAKFLERGFSVDVTDIANTPLHYVLKHRRRVYAKLMLPHVKNVDARDEKGNTALNIIVQYSAIESDKNDEEMIRVLLSKGADIYQLNNQCSSPLISAVSNFKLNILKIFKEHGADFARLYRTGNLLRYFLNSNTQTDLKNYEAVFNFLIDQGCQVNAKDERGITPLHLACTFGKSKIVQRLIDLGANVSSRESLFWYSPLHVAVENHHPHLLEILVKNGADVNAKTSKGQTALHLQCHEDTMEKLIKLGARIDVVDKKDLLPLQIAIQGRNVEKMKGLMRFGADINDNTRHTDVNDVVTCRVMTEHLIKLKAAGLPIDGKLKCVLEYGGDWTKTHNNCLAEIKKLKSYKLDARTSLYDFLRMNRNFACSYVYDDRLKKLICSPTFDKQFPMYHVLISSTYYMAVERRRLLEPAKLAWLELTKIALPDVCIHEILSHLSNFNLRIMSKEKRRSRERRKAIEKSSSTAKPTR